MGKLEYNVKVEPHLVECKLIVKITKGDDKISYSAPAHIESLSLDDFNKAIELLHEYKNSLK